MICLLLLFGWLVYTPLRPCRVSGLQPKRTSPSNSYPCLSSLRNQTQPWVSLDSSAGGDLSRLTYLGGARLSNNMAIRIAKCIGAKQSRLMPKSAWLKGVDSFNLTCFVFLSLLLGASNMSLNGQKAKQPTSSHYYSAGFA